MIFDSILINSIAPEVFVTGMACIILLAEVFATPNLKFITYWLSLLTLVVSIGITYFILPPVGQITIDDVMIVDRMACILKIILYLLLVFIFIYSRQYMTTRDLQHGEFFALSLFSLLGMMLVISSGNFLTLFLGLELIVLPLYAIIVLVKNQANYVESAMKYFIIGSVGTALLLYGISLVYGATGNLNFSSVSAPGVNTVLLSLGMLFIISGIALEFGAVPFHMWLPDVYEGSPTTVTMIIGTIPKIAVFAIAYRLLTLAFANLQPDLQQAWQQSMLLLGLLSVGIGNIMAIAQTNLKRMLAYSTIGHIGFILLALFAAPQSGYVAAIFYTIIYVFMALAAFAVIMRLTTATFEADKIEDYVGLAKRDPWLAFIMLLVMLSLAGIPPLIGFYAKFLVLQAIVNAGYPWVAVVALVFSVIGTYYYLRIIRVMYFDAPAAATEVTKVTNGMSVSGNLLVSGNGLLLLLYGLYPASLIYLCVSMLK